MRPLDEQPLVANPNCVAFAAPAGALLGGRTWADLQDVAERVLAPFHRDTGLPSMCGFSWRVSLSRRNERLSQGVLYVALDGPATARHLDALEAAVGALGFGTAPANVERLPVNGAVAALARGGTVYGVWSRDPPGPDGKTGEPWIRRIEARPDGRVRAVVARASEVGPSDVSDRLPQAIGVPAPYGEAEMAIERLRLAFALRFTERIMDADGVVRDREVAFLGEVFPPDLVSVLGLDTPALRDEYFAAAAERLPAELGHHDKLALVGLFFSACFCDGSLDAREMRVLREAGELLGLTREEVVRYLQRFW